MTKAKAGKPARVSFSFGDPEPVMEGRVILDMAEAWSNGRWYEMPLPAEGLAKSFRAGPHHSSAIYLKAGLLTRRFVSHPRLARADFEQLAIDYLTFGNAYLERRRSMLGSAMRYAASMARFTRRGVEPGVFWWVPGWKLETAYRAGDVGHLKRVDVGQEVYGMPDYLGGLQAAWLNEQATLFRRKYFANGAHMGYILYITDPEIPEDDLDAIKAKMRQAKGVGNFRNLFIGSSSGKPDGVKIIPVGEAATKDEFFNVKNVSRDDVLAAHRVPPQLLGVVPQNNGGFGDVRSAADVFHWNEIDPLEQKMGELNEWAGEEIVRFRPYEPMAVAGGAAPG